MHDNKQVATVLESSQAHQHFVWPQISITAKKVKYLTTANIYVYSNEFVGNNEPQTSNAGNDIEEGSLENDRTKVAHSVCIGDKTVEQSLPVRSLTEPAPTLSGEDERSNIILEEV